MHRRFEQTTIGDQGTRGTSRACRASLCQRHRRFAGTVAAWAERRARRGPSLLLVLLFGLIAAEASAADWPMYRGDAARTGHAADTLALPLVTAWTYSDAHRPQPAWPNSRRMQFDRAMQMVSLGDRVVMGSSVDGTVFALDAATGEEVWRFFTAGPIRFAPALWHDLAFVASDDGYLYALRLADGALQWKHRGGPSDANVLGNQKMISKWPMRGGPVVVGGIVYSAAGIWPSEGIFLAALDAKTGAVAWRNSDSGSIYMPQPHGGANAKSGVSAQGYLVASGDRLFVPTGRAVPASFDRRTGKFEYFHLQKYGHNGAALAMVIDGVLLNGGVGFDVQGGERLTQLGDGPIAAMADGVVRAFDGKITEYQWREEEKLDRKGKLTRVRALAPIWSEDAMGDWAAMITAGRQVVLGGRDRVCLFDADTKKIVAQLPVDGVAYGLAVASGKLLVSTDQGSVYCFTSHASPKDSTGELTRGVPWKADLTKTAEAILQRTGVTKGYCLDIGCGDGLLARELALRTQLHVIAIDSNPDNVRHARENLFLEGLLGARVTVLQRDLANTELPSYFADLIVSQRSLTQGIDAGTQAEAKRLQRPFGGQICWRRGAKWVVTQREGLPGSGSWTHQYADPANTVNSGDSLVKNRLKVLWYRDFDFAIPSRHGRAPAPLAKDGRLFHEGINGLLAVDAYNGHELWRYDVPNVLKAYDGDELMGVSGTGSNICLGGDSVFIRHGSRCLRLDAKNGSLIGEYQTPLPKDASSDRRPDWGYIAWVEGVLFGSTANAEHVVTYRFVNRGGDMTKQLTESTSLFAINTHDGEPLWSYTAKSSIRHNAIAIADGKVFLIDRPLALFDREKRPKSKVQPPGKLVALDARTGQLVWAGKQDAFGTMLAASATHHIVLMCYQPTRFRLDSERGGRMAAYQSQSGEPLWDIEAKYASRPTLNDRTIYTQGGAWDLLTGKEVPFEFERSYGCGILASSKNMLLFRSATLGYYDLSGARETIDYGGIRPGCWINALPVGGLVLLPDATSGCRCSYLNKTWIALEPK